MDGVLVYTYHGSIVQEIITLTSYRNVILYYNVSKLVCDDFIYNIVYSLIHDYTVTIMKQWIEI